VTDPSMHARLAELQRRLAQSSPVPLEGQEAIALDEPPHESDGSPTRPSPPAQQPLW
jgi:hypothetical protein